MNKIKELMELKEPYIHLALVDEKDFHKLHSVYDDTNNINVVVKFIEGNKCTAVDSLFSEFGKVLEFPKYFGYNWDAFNDCIWDLNWLPGDAYLLLINNIDKLLVDEEEEVFRIFIKIIKLVVDSWTNGTPYKPFPPPPTPFHIVFQCSKDKESEVKARFETVGLKHINTLNITE